MRAGDQRLGAMALKIAAIWACCRTGRQNMASAWPSDRRAARINAQGVFPGFTQRADKRNPAGAGFRGAGSMQGVVGGQSLQTGRVRVEDQDPHIGLRGQVQHLDQLNGQAHIQLLLA